MNPALLTPNSNKVSPLKQCGYSFVLFISVLILLLNFEWVHIHQVFLNQACCEWSPVVVCLIFSNLRALLVIKRNTNFWGKGEIHLTGEKRLALGWLIICCLTLVVMFVYADHRIIGLLDTKLSLYLTALYELCFAGFDFTHTFKTNEINRFHIIVSKFIAAYWITRCRCIDYASSKTITYYDLEVFASLLLVGLVAPNLTCDSILELTFIW